MALSPHRNDPARKDILKRIAALKKLDTFESREALRSLYNVGDMPAMSRHPRNLKAGLFGR